MEQMNLSNCSGIYLILNIIDWKAYVGQTVNSFNNRDHIYELEKGKDSTDFQRDYDEGTEFVYMIAYYDPDKDFKLDDVLEKSVRRKFCFVGKLAAPYILLLNSKKFD